MGEVEEKGQELGANFIDESKREFVEEFEKRGDRSGCVLRAIKGADLEGVSDEFMHNYERFSGFGLGVFDGDKCVGFMTIQRSKMDPELADMMMKYVERDYRKKGIGTDLSKVSRDFVQELGYKGVEGGVNGAFYVDQLGRKMVIWRADPDQLRRERSDLVGGLDSLKSRLYAGPIWIRPKMDFNDGVFVGPDGKYMNITLRDYFDPADAPDNLVKCVNLDDVEAVVKKAFYKEE